MGAGAKIEKAILGISAEGSKVSAVIKDKIGNAKSEGCCGLEVLTPDPHHPPHNKTVHLKKSLKPAQYISNLL